MASQTPRKHFDEDIDRAENLLSLAKELEDNSRDERLYKDVRSSAVALAVGAMDAYFCDAYVDCLTSVLKAYYKGDWQGDLPPKYAKRELPAGEVLNFSRANRPLWALRMAARKMMERNSMLSISEVNNHFNGILPNSQKLWNDFVDSLVQHGYRSFTSIVQEDLDGLTGNELAKARNRAIKKFKGRISNTVQFRHDWIHNCGRPKEAIQDYTHGEARTRVREIRILIKEFDIFVQKHRKV